MAFVVDASIIAAWLLPDEVDAGADALLTAMVDSRPIAPDLLAHEFRSIVAKAVRRSRVDPNDLALLVRRFGQLGIVDAGAGDMSGILALALKHKLTSNDAAYLDLAMDRRLPLATLDAQLRAAANEEDIVVLPETPRSSPAAA